MASAVHNLIFSFRFLGVVLLLYIISSYVYAWHRLRHVKGPFLASFSYFFILRTELAFRQADCWGDIIAKYGNLVRIGPNDLLTSDPEIVRRMNGARSSYRRSGYYTSSRVDPYHDNLFSTTDTRAHDKLKAQMSHGYGGKDVPNLEGDIDEQLASLVHLLRSKYAKPGKPVDFAVLSQYFTSDVLTKIAYGKEFGYIRSESDVYGLMEVGNFYIKVQTISSEVPWMAALFTNQTVQRLFGPKPGDEEGFGRMLGLSQRVVASRFGADAKDELDMLGSFVRHGLSQRECEAEVPFQILAGSDTTARAIRGTLMYIVAAPRVYSTLQQKIDTAIAQGSISEPVKADEARQLDYLQGCIYEGLRLSLPATILAMKQTPPEGDTIEGRFIPGGTRVGVAIKAIMRNPDLFGNDADIFRPERWVGIDPAKRRFMSDTVELVFGYGRWGCSGKPVALMELNKIFIQLLRNFDFQVVNPSKPVEQCHNINIYMEKGMWLKVEDRDTSV